MYLKLHKLISDLQDLSGGWLKQILQHIQVQSYWRQFADILSLIVAIFLDYLVEYFLRRDSNHFGLDHLDWKEGKIYSFGFDQG